MRNFAGCRMMPPKWVSTTIFNDGKCNNCFWDEKPANLSQKHGSVSKEGRNRTGTYPQRFLVVECSFDRGSPACLCRQAESSSASALKLIRKFACQWDLIWSKSVDHGNHGNKGEETHSFFPELWWLIATEPLIWRLKVGNGILLLSETQKCSSSDASVGSRHQHKKNPYLHSLETQPKLLPWQNPGQDVQPLWPYGILWSYAYLWVNFIHPCFSLHTPSQKKKTTYLE